MKRFNEKGAIVIPNPLKNAIVKEHALALTEIYCPNGHSLINSRANFNGRSGIVLVIEQDGKKSLAAFSPIFGDKTRIALDIDLKSGENVILRCPECDVELPVHSNCHCGGKMFALFRTPDADFSECVAVCGRVDCVNSQLVQGGQLISNQMLELL